MAKQTKNPIPTDNPHRVPLRQWRKWSPAARYVFNHTYEDMMECPYLYLHLEISTEHWITTAWNAAFTAACHLRDLEKINRNHAADRSGLTRVLRRNTIQTHS